MADEVSMGWSRYFLVQQAKEAQIFGILMGTLGVSKYLDIVRSVQKLIKAYGLARTANVCVCCFPID